MNLFEATRKRATKLELLIERSKSQYAMIPAIFRDPGFASNFSRFPGTTKGPQIWKP